MADSQSTRQLKALMSVQHVQQTFNLGTGMINVLKDISFDIQDDTFNIIFGPSGSGKSTLLNILTGLQPPTSGSVIFNDQDIYQLPPDDLARFRSHRIGIVYQQNYWVQSLSVRENVALPLYFRGYPKNLANEMADLALERIEMQHYSNRNPQFLSGGEQQRVGMARALVNDPMLIIADEPTGNLDSENGDKVMKLLHQFNADMHRTVVLVTHNMEYLPLADRLWHIQDGALQQLKHDTPEGVANELLNELRGRINTMVKARRLGGKAS